MTVNEIGTTYCGRCGRAFKPEEEIERGYCTRCLKGFWWAKMWLTKMEYDGDWRTIKISEYGKLGRIYADIGMCLMMGKKMRAPTPRVGKRKGEGK